MHAGCDHAARDVADGSALPAAEAALVNATVTDAILDWIIRNAHRIVLQADSMRNQRAAPP